MSKVAPIINDYIPSRGRVGGNTHHLKQMFKEQVGVELKKDQAHLIVQRKSGRSASNFGQYRLLSSFIQALANHDAGGWYLIDTCERSDGSGLQFRRLLVLPSRIKRSWHAHDGLLSVDATFLTSVCKGMLFLASCLDSNNQLTFLSFGSAKTEDGATWKLFLSNLFHCLGSVRIVKSDGAKGLQDQCVKPLLDTSGVQHSRCVWHILHKN